MLTIDSRRKATRAAAHLFLRLRGCLTVLLAAGILASACNGNIGQNNPTDRAATRASAAWNVKPGDVTVPPTPISQDVAYVAVRKVENLLTGMAPTDADVALVTQQGAAGLQKLIPTG